MANITTSDFSKTKSGEEVRLYQMDNGTMSVGILTLGGIISSILVPDKNGKLAEVCLGFSSVSGYESQTAFVGAMIGRYANRIAKGRFTLNGKEYLLAQNDGQNHLHGGVCGFDKRVWTARIENGDVVMSLFSPDGEEGYPGNLRVEVRYRLSDKNELILEYTAVSDQDTIVNLTNHSYFNLNGRGKGDILRHQLKINADSFTRTDSESIPTGEIIPVEGTPFDFREFHGIGERISVDSVDLAAGNGYDHNFILNGKGFREAAVVFEPYTGRKLTVSTDMPGIQFYSGNYLDKCTPKKPGLHYGKHTAIALEPHFFPDSPNRPEFPSCVLKAGEKYDSRTVFRFSVVKD